MVGILDFNHEADYKELNAVTKKTTIVLCHGIFLDLQMKQLKMKS